MAWQLEVVNARTNDSHWYDFGEEPTATEMEYGTRYRGVNLEGNRLEIRVHHANTPHTVMENNPSPEEGTG